MKNQLNNLLFLSLLIGFSSLGFAQEGKVTIKQDKSIERLLEYKRDVTTNTVFKIQIFSGERATAEKVMSEFRSVYVDIPSSMEFNTPNYKIWVGNFRDRLEADRALARIKKNYTYAFIFQPKD
jgi:hypothetical protein